MTINQRAAVCIVVLSCMGLALLTALPRLEDNIKEPRIVLGPVVIIETLDDLNIEEFKCQFDPPLKHITLITHYYDNYGDLNDYYQEDQELDKATAKKIWGWSNCIWQPDDDWSACDLHLRVPQTVEDVAGDYSIETSGHEFWHAACGMFHE